MSDSSRESAEDIRPVSSRRDFIRNGVVGVASISFGAMLARREANAVELPYSDDYGPVAPVRDLTTGLALIALPAGFSYFSYGWTGQLLADGQRTPAVHDGMDVVAAKGNEIVLVRNHEQGTGGIPFNAPAAYDPGYGFGGTTNVLFDAVAGKFLGSHASLAGTYRNCAGGPTPWGSWLTCEEGTAGPRLGFERLHGYVFEVPAAGDGPADPFPLRAMGRFVHEAVAVDPATGIVYLTEDRPTAGFYRFLPNKPGALRLGGRLQMLAVDGQPAYDTRSKQPGGVSLPATWVDIQDPDPYDAGWNPLSVFNQGLKLGGAVFARLEGCCFDRGRVLMTTTTGGDAGVGQVWEYQPQPDGPGQLRLIFESPSAQFLHKPDNIVVSPRGGVLLCEDHEGSDRLMGLD